MSPAGAEPRRVLHRGRSFRLSEAARADDLRRGTLTLLEEASGEPLVLSSRELMGDGPSPGREPVALRALFEEALALGFADPEIEEILLFAARHRILEAPGG